MKKNQKMQRDFVKLKSQLTQIEHIVKNSRDVKLWGHEAAVRKKSEHLKLFTIRD